MGRRKHTHFSYELPSTAEIEDAIGSVEAPVVAPAAPPVAPTQWRVVETKRISWFGHLTVLQAGAVISVMEYGPEGLARLQDQGLKLEPVI